MPLRGPRVPPVRELGDDRRAQGRPYHSREQILADYPYLESDDITAALEYAVRRR